MTRSTDKTEKPQKFKATLSQEEINEDFRAMTGCRPPTRPKKRPKNVQRIVDVRHWCSIISFVVGLFHLFLIVQILGFLLTMPNAFSFDAFQRLNPGSRLNRITRELYNVKGPFSLSLFSFGCLRNKILTTYLMLFSWNLSNEKYGMFSFSHLFIVIKRGHTYPYINVLHLLWSCRCSRPLHGT